MYRQISAKREVILNQSVLVRVFSSEYDALRKTKEDLIWLSWPMKRNGALNSEGDYAKRLQVKYDA